MSRLGKFIELPGGERSLLIRSHVLLLATRLGLWVLPFRSLRALLVSKRPTKPVGETVLPVGRIVWAIKTAARYVPACTCLVQALVAERVLTRLGHDAKMHIGVAKDATGSLEAHAWVEGNQGVLIGELPDLDRFAPLTPLHSGHTPHR